MTVFLSYSHAAADQDAAEALVAELDLLNVTYWIDRRKIPFSFSWRAVVEEAIRGATLVVILSSPSWDGSENCRHELEMAEEMGKPLVRTVLHGSVPRQVAGHIAYVVANLDNVDVAHTDLLVRSTQWDRDGRPEGSLPRENELRRFQIVAASDRQLNQTAHEFVEAGTATARRRRRLKAAGAALVVILFVAGWIAQAVSKKADDLFAAQAASLSGIAAVHDQTQLSPYAGLARGMEQISSGDTSGYAVAALAEAINVPVPAESFTVPGDSLAGFAVSPLDPSPVLRTSAGAAVDVKGLRTANTELAGSTPSSGSGSVATATSGSLTAAAAGGGIVVRDAATGRSVRIVDDQPVEALAASQSGHLVAIAHQGTGTISFHESTSGELATRVAVNGPVGSMAFSPDGRVVAVGAGERVVLVDLVTGRAKGELRGPPDTVRAVAWTSDGASVWAINGEHRLSRWQWRTGARLADDPSAWYVSLSSAASDGTHYAVTRDGTIHRISSAADDVIFRGPGPVLSASFDSKVGRVLLGMVDGSARLHDLTSGEDRTLPAVAGCSPAASSFAPDSAVAAVSCLGGPVRRVDVRSAAWGATTDIAGGSSAVAFGPDGTLYASGGDGSLFTVGSDGAPEDVGPPPNATTWRTITLSANGSTIMLTGNGTGKLGHLYIGKANHGGWDWYTISLSADAGEQSRAAALSADGSVAAIGSSGGVVHLVNADAGNLAITRTEPVGAITGLVFDGEKIVLSTRAGTVDIVASCGRCDTPALMDIASRRLDQGRANGLIS